MDIRPINTAATAPVAISESGTPPAAPKTAAPVQIADPVRAASPAESAQQLDDAVKSINKALKELTQGVEFTIDSNSDKPIVKVVDHETKEVLRQIPSEEALAISRALDRVQGLLIRQQA
ncbi:MAG TPA: flagellar protein FlaG [Noviherbaspirillum sp.]|nr:flagellar protein FlaG [Noviherbaspirillum sp.]